MKDSHYDVVVFGLGILGAATLDALARRGLRCVGVDAREPGHELATSSGESRLFRHSYFEDDAYIPLCRDSRRAWLELERDNTRRLFYDRGFLMLGARAHTAYFEDLQKKMAGFGVESQILNAAELRQRFPQFQIHNDDRAFWEADAGMLHAEACLQALIARAEKNQATLLRSTTLNRLERKADSLRLEFSNGQKLETKKILLSLGPWSTDFGYRHLPELSFPRLKLEKAPVYWLKAHPAPGLPCFGFQSADEFVYGFPTETFAPEIKVSRYRSEEECANAERRPPARAEEWVPVEKALQRHLPSLSFHPTQIKNCIYTSSADENFILSYLDAEERIFFLGGDSGHAFKMAPTLGEISARELAVPGSALIPDLFKLERFD